MAGSIPVALLAEAIGHPVIVELKTGELYKGFLCETEESLNMVLEKATLTAKDGRQRSVEHVLLRGSQVRLVALPDFLQSSPLFTRVRRAKKQVEKAAASADTAPASASSSKGKVTTAAARSIFRAPGAI